MPTNVTQKDATLNQVIAFAETERAMAFVQTVQAGDDAAKSWYDGYRAALDQMIARCSRMLGYSGSMPTGVENQSEDAK